MSRISSLRPYPQVSARHSDDTNLLAVDLYRLGAVLAHEVYKWAIVVPHELRFRNIQIERLLVSTARVFQVYAKGLLNEMSNRHNSEVRINTTNGSYYTGLFFCVLDCLCGHSNSYALSLRTRTTYLRCPGRRGPVGGADRTP